MKRARTLAIVAISLIGTMAATGSDAIAQGGVPNCDDLNNPIFMTGTTAVIPVIRHFGAKLNKLNPPVTLLWNESSPGGCTDANNFVTSNLLNNRITFSQYADDPASGKVVVTTCNGKLNQVPDLVINDVSYSSCPLAYSESIGLPSNFREFTGPVQGMVPIVALNYPYTYDAITVEELQDLYMCGGNGNILTFTNTNTIYDYNCDASGMRELWARGLGVPNGAQLSCIVGGGRFSTLLADSMTTTVQGTMTPDTTIGYTSTEFYDQYRGQVLGWKVRGVNQVTAYLPDTDGTKLDKINIREGRYTIQGALRLVAQVDPNDPSGVPVNPNAKKIVDWMQGNPVSDPTLQLPVDINAIYATTGVVPQCAMRVTKDSDMPVFRHYRDPWPCHCSFEMLATGKTSPGCVACTDSSTCAANQICSHGYCE